VGRENGAPKGSSAARNRYRRLTALCLRLPRAECDARGDHSIYRVRGKVFAYYLDNHHGDGIVSVCVRSDSGENRDLARLVPWRYYLPAHIGARGWFGLRLDRGRVAWREVAELLERSYRLTAPKSYVAKLDDARSDLDNRRVAARAARARG
jgi:predicted DNA-binding protein (MmcQ/YjbR family)